MVMIFIFDCVTLQTSHRAFFSLSNSSSEYADYITPTKQIFSLAEISSQEIFELIQKIPGNKANGLDYIPARLLKEAAPVVRSLTYITNPSITTGK